MLNNYDNVWVEYFVNGLIMMSLFRYVTILAGNLNTQTTKYNGGIISGILVMILTTITFCGLAILFGFMVGLFV